MSVRIVQKEIPVKGKRWVIEDHELGYFIGFDSVKRCPVFLDTHICHCWPIKSEAEEFARKHAMEVEE